MTRRSNTCRKRKGVRTICSYSFCLLSCSSIIAFLREEGGARSVTEGACVTFGLRNHYYNALSLTRLRRELPPGGSLFMFIYDLSIFLTSTELIKDNKYRNVSTEIHRTQLLKIGCFSTAAIVCKYFRFFNNLLCENQQSDK